MPESPEITSLRSEQKTLKVTIARLKRFEAGGALLKEKQARLKEVNRLLKAAK